MFEHCLNFPESNAYYAPPFLMIFRIKRVMQFSGERGGTALKLPPPLLSPAFLILYQRWFLLQKFRTVRLTMRWKNNFQQFWNRRNFPLITIFQVRFQYCKFRCKVWLTSENKDGQILRFYSHCIFSKKRGFRDHYFENNNAKHMEKKQKDILYIYKRCFVKKLIILLILYFLSWYNMIATWYLKLWILVDQ